MRKNSLIPALVAACLALAGCSAGGVGQYADREPRLVPEEFFNGDLRAHGVIKDRSGNVIRYFNASIKAYWVDGVGTLEEDFVFDDGELSRRVWTLEPTGENTYRGTAGDVVGDGELTVAGNSMFLDYVLRVPYRDGTIDLRIDDRMYLVSPDVLINESQNAETGFQRGPDPAGDREVGGVGVSLQAPGPLHALAERAWFNALWFQSFWLCAVLGRELLLPVCAAMLCLHFYLVADRRRECLRLVPVAALGIAVDGSLSLAGVYQFGEGVVLPLWLCCLWFAFATTLWRSLGFLARYPLLAGLAGALAMPFNYWAGEKLGAVAFGLPLPHTLAIMALTWAIVFPLMARYAARRENSKEAVACC